MPKIVLKPLQSHYKQKKLYLKIRIRVCEVKARIDSRENRQHQKDLKNVNDIKPWTRKNPDTKSAKQAQQSQEKNALKQNANAGRTHHYTLSIRIAQNAKEITISLFMVKDKQEG